MCVCVEWVVIHVCGCGVSGNTCVCVGGHNSNR